MKRCSRCRRTKALSDYSRDHSRSDGHAYRCRTCRSRENRAYYRRNRAHLIETARQRRISDRIACRVCGTLNPGDGQLCSAACRSAWLFVKSTESVKNIV